MSENHTPLNSILLELVQLIGAPRNSVSVWLWSEGHKEKLIVRLDPRVISLKSKVPSVFHGYRTQVENRTAARALA